MGKSYYGRFERVILKLEYRQHQAFAEGSERETDFLRKATRLWNWIDSQRDCEDLWRTMAERLPMAFRDPENVNSMRFTYARSTTAAWDAATRRYDHYEYRWLFATAKKAAIARGLNEREAERAADRETWRFKL